MFGGRKYEGPEGSGDDTPTLVSGGTEGDLSQVETLILLGLLGLITVLLLVCICLLFSQIRSKRRANQIMKEKYVKRPREVTVAVQSTQMVPPRLVSLDFKAMASAAKAGRLPTQEVKSSQHGQSTRKVSNIIIAPPEQESTFERQEYEVVPDKENPNLFRKYSSESSGSNPQRTLQRKKSRKTYKSFSFQKKTDQQSSPAPSKPPRVEQSTLRKYSSGESKRSGSRNFGNTRTSLWVQALSKLAQEEEAQRKLEREQSAQKAATNKTLKKEKKLSENISQEEYMNNLENRRESLFRPSREFLKDSLTEEAFSRLGRDDKKVETNSQDFTELTGIKDDDDLESML